MKQEAIVRAGSVSLTAVAPPILALVVYSIMAWPLRDWLIDDAAISMAYAANWTAGHGLVAQPGLTPVEGYSNPLWVMLLAALDLLGAMSVPAIKALSLLLVGLAFISFHETCRPLLRPIARSAVMLLMATCSSVVTWTTSGLENPLTLLLACELLRIAFKPPTSRTAIHLGVLVALMGMNRPEGIAFLAFPLLVLWRHPRLAALCAAVALGIFAGFLCVRFWTFGDVVPNTFYAKKADGFGLVMTIANAINLKGAAFGSGLVLAAVFIAGAFAKRAAIPFAMIAVAGGLFLLLPWDWMPDRRFATPLFPALFLLTGLALSRVLPVLLLLVALAFGVSLHRLGQVYLSPPMPITTVTELGAAFEKKARHLDVEAASILAPDIGGLLLHSRMRVFDLAGLTDRTIARTLYRDKPRFYDYIFDQVQPTFIVTHGNWAFHAALERDPRFRRDVTLTEAVDPNLLKRGIAKPSGHYVRRDELR